MKIRITAAKSAAIGLLALAAAPLTFSMGVALAQESRGVADAEAAFGGETVGVTGPEADALVAQANGWLNGLQAMSGRFQQINPDGTVAEGDFYIQRPGRLRLAYDPPSALVYVADGRVVWSIDSDLNTADRLPLEETPLNYLLKPDVDLGGDANVRGVGRQGDLVMISVEDPRGQMPGQLVLVFSDGEGALREWVAIDEYQRQTRVVFLNAQRQAELDPELFMYDGDTGSRRPGQR